MRIRVTSLCDGDVLGGAPAGRAALGKFLAELPDRLGEPTRVYLDFGGIALITASFLREAVFGFRDIARMQYPNVYPIIANATSMVRDEICELVELRNDVLILCKINNNDLPSNVEIVGNLEEKQIYTYKIVCEKKEAAAPDLMREFGQVEGMGHTTAWNNRLSSLNKMGLLMEYNRGRSKIYRPTLEV